MKVRHLAMVGALAVSFPALAQNVVFKIAHFLPSAAPAQQRVLQPWCEEISKESGGRIVCQFYPAMQLGGTPSQLVDQVKNGVADIAWTGPGYSAGRFPAIEAFELPFMVSDSTSSSKATTRATSRRALPIASGRSWKPLWCRSSPRRSRRRTAGS